VVVAGRAAGRVALVVVATAFGFATCLTVVLAVVVKGAGSGVGSLPRAVAVSTPAASSATPTTAGRVPRLVDPHSNIRSPDARRAAPRTGMVLRLRRRRREWASGLERAQDGDADRDSADACNLDAADAFA
jgi:hypothetical protein